MRRKYYIIKFPGKYGQTLCRGLTIDQIVFITGLIAKMHKRLHHGYDADKLYNEVQAYVEHNKVNYELIN